MSLINLPLQQCDTSSSIAAACGHSAMSPEDLAGLAASPTLRKGHLVHHVSSSDLYYLNAPYYNKTNN